MRRALALGIALLFLPTLAFADYTTPTSYWRFDEASGNAADATATGNTLTNNGTATYSAGKINNAAVLVSGSSQYFSHADNASLSVTGDFTWTGWVDFTSLPGSGGDSGIAGKFSGTGTNPRSWRFYIDNSAGSYTLHAAISSTGASATDNRVGWSPSANTFYYLSMVYTAAAGKVQFYVNGVQQGADKTGYPNSIVDNTIPYLVGKLQDDAGVYCDCKFDEVGFYNQALTSTDISTLYNSGAGFAYPFSVAVSVKPPDIIFRGSWEGGW